MKPSGKSLYANKDWFQAVDEGIVPGYSTYEKFGECSSVTTATDPVDVWDGGIISGAEIYTFSTTADIDTISSSNAGDTQDILIEGLDATYAFVTQTATLDGQNKVTLSTPLMRVFRMINVGTTDIAGFVYCYVDGLITAGVPNVKTTIRAVINDGNNQTLMCVYTVPLGKTAYFWGGYVAVSRGPAASTFADFTWRARAEGGVFAVKSRVSCQSGGNSSWSYTYKSPIMLPEKTDIVIRCEQVGGTVGVAGGFTVILKDN